MNMDVFDIREMDASGFGIAAQYERQLLRILSVAGRFAYLGLDVDTVTLAEGHIVNMDMTSFSAEGHVRLYPFGGIFFVNGMAGWGFLGVDLSGQDRIGDIMHPFDGRSSRNYLKLGAKVGWRFTFGNNPRGFVFEPSFGWNHGIGLGATHGSQIDLSDQGITRQELEDNFRALESLIFMGGPRMSLAFGFRF